MIKALFFDIDGTLVSFKTHEIPVSTIEALTAAKAKGIHIFISTGRPRVIINNLSALQERNLIDGYITMNGAYCFVEDTVTYYSNLSPGKYTFRVKAANNDGIWNPEEAILQITVNPPFYKTWWAYSLYG